MGSCRCMSLQGFRNPAAYFFSSKLKHKVQLPPQARSHSFRDEQEDADMSGLRCRIEQVRIREKLNTCYKLGHGWNYSVGYDDVRKKHNMLISSFQLLLIVVNSIALVFLTASLCMLLLSFFISNHPQIK